MFVTDAGDTEYQLRLFFSEIYAVWILQKYNAGFLYGTLRLTCTVRNGNTHAHICRDELFTLLHRRNIALINIAELNEQFACCLNGFLFGYRCLIQAHAFPTDELFSRNAVTVVNFWFTTCGPCVGEIAELDALNKELANKGGALIGINSFTLGGDEAAISEAKDVLSKKGATYRNVYFDSDSEAGKFTANIFAYPTTYVVDRSGNIVGEPIVGAVTEKKQAETLQKLIDQALAADMG